MDVSIIIVNYKTAQMVCNCIHSIISHTSGISYEVIVVDNCSGDDINTIISTEFSDEITLLPLSENIGFGRANNKGIEIAKGRNILFLNPDTLLINNAIKILSDTLDSNEQVGACGGNLYDEQMLPALSFRRLFPGIRMELFEMTAHKLENIIYHGNWMFNHTSDNLKVGYITGADLMVKRKVIDFVGSFSPAFFMYNEDTDLCLRIHQHGYDVLSVPSAKIQHLEGKSTQESGNTYSERGLFLSEQGRHTYYIKNIPYFRRMIANGIYHCSLRILYFISLFSKKHNSQAFKYRIHAIKELHKSS